MFNWLKRNVDCAGNVFFRGTMAPRLGNFSQLAAPGLKVTPLNAGNAHWAVNVEHPKWGKAMVVCLRDVPPVPRDLYEYDHRLNDDDREAIAAGGTTVTVSVSGGRNNVLRDRKLLLRFLNLMMGDDGLIAMDLTGQKFWPRAALQDELSHDADLDIDSMFISHLVTAEGEENKPEDERRVGWLHTHGLAQIGALDFDILNPSSLIATSTGYDTVRALAYHILEEGSAIAGKAVQVYVPAPVVQLVPVEEFNKQCPENLRAMRGDTTDETHNTKRVICCDEIKRRMFGLLPAAVRPHRGLSTVEDDHMMAIFTNAATTLMADRAQKTFGLFRQFSKEFAEFEGKPIAKIGFDLDGAKDATDREHIWVEVHDVRDDAIEGTLLNQPFNVSKYKQGDRCWQPLERLTDWTIITPLGWITPRNMSLARALRTHGDKIREVFAAAKAGGAGE